ncbi:MAG: multidrug transporter, partial [Bacteroidales bacterium]|nr:multidrug transporter [Bacteroidales bacterium]
MNRNILLWGVAIGLLCSGCSGVKGLTTPSAELPDRYVGYIETDTANMAEIEWWKFYSDPTLCGYISKALDNNHDL